MIKKILQRLSNLIGKLENGENQEDPLDELLIAKGIDPEKLMEDVSDQRNYDGKSNAIYRALGRIEKTKERGEKMRKQSHLGGGRG